VASSRGTLLAGIVSWGGGCAEGAPGMYGRVSSFHAWIVATMNGEAPPPPPEGDGEWMCPNEYLGDGECDCGCGAFDNDCPSASVDACQYNNCDQWQPTQGLQLNDSDPTQCEGGVPPDGEDGPCPPNASLTPDGTACQCNEGFIPNDALTACIDDPSVDEPDVCPPNATQTAGGDCACDDGFEQDGDACIDIDTQNDDDDDDSDEDSDDDDDRGGCTSAAGASPLAMLALAMMLKRRRS
jgi:hypothetical protein